MGFLEKSKWPVNDCNCYVGRQAQQTLDKPCLIFMAALYPLGKFYSHNVHGIVEDWNFLLLWYFQ